MKEQRTLVKIAHYYYKQKLTQNEIAEKLGLSRQKVNRLTQRLEEEGIIEIKIKTPKDLYVDLEEELEKKYGLKQIIIIPTIDEENIIEHLGIAGGDYLSDILETQSSIGVSWGKTLNSVAKNMSLNSEKNISIIQLVGGFSRSDISMNSNEITRLMAQKLGGKPWFIYAPAIVKNKEMKEALMEDENIKIAFEKMTFCNIAVVGIGELNEASTLYKENFINKQDLDYLVGLGAVGDICFIPYDKEGRIIKNVLDNRVMGIDIDTLKKIPTVIGIAAGQQKLLAIHGALRGKLIDVLITDKSTADGLLHQ